MSLWALLPMSHIQWGSGQLLRYSYFTIVPGVLEDAGFGAWRPSLMSFLRQQPGWRLPAL